MVVSTDIKHLAIIMDGNARWAKANAKSRAQGHRSGAVVLKSLIPEIIKYNIPYLTLFAFSYENWQRSKNEIFVLINLLKHYLHNELQSFCDNDVRLKVIGRFDNFSADLQQKIVNAIEATKNNKRLTLCIALSYGSRNEMVDTCQKIIDSGIKKIDEEIFKNYLYDPQMPDVDLLIRTGAVFRISNFLLWQISYAELYFSQKYWPDFNTRDLANAISDYAKRKRTFGQR